MTSASPVASSATGTSLVRLPRVAAAAGVALVLNLAAFVAGSTAGATWDAGLPVAINPVMVSMASLVPVALAGAATWYVAARRTGFQRAAAWVGLVFGVITAPAPFVMSGDLPTAAGLASMHVITAIAWFFAVRPAADARRA
ncbi:MAG: DUF6069 family protein [Chloroflexota bacterium]